MYCKNNARILDVKNLPSMFEVELHTWSGPSQGTLVPRKTRYSSRNAPINSKIIRSASLEKYKKNKTKNIKEFTLIFQITH